MEFDHTHSGPGDWAFPSPTATPTSASHNHNIFLTPKTGTYFQDAFTTPQISTGATPRQLEYATMTPFPSHHPSDSRRSNSYAHMQAAATTRSQAMPPRAHAAYQTHVTSSSYAHPPLPTSQPDPAESYNIVQMQTPPPTRGTSAKKPQSQEVAFGTPSTIVLQRHVTRQNVQDPNENAQHMPQALMNFPQLPLPPQAYEFGDMGPASVPAMPQTQLLWEQTMYPRQPMLGDPFTPASTEFMQWPTQQAIQSNAPPVSFNMPALEDYLIQAPLQNPPAPTLQFTAALAQKTLTTASVDPSLVYSSPIRPGQGFSGKRTGTAPLIIRREGITTRLNNAAKGRKDGGVMAKYKTEHKRSETAATADSISTMEPTLTANGRLSLQRSNTTGSRSQLPQSNTTGSTSTGHRGPRSATSITGKEKAMGRSNSLSQVTRTVSPLKRAGMPALGSISESTKPHKPSVILTIDAFGRAQAVRTEVAPATLSPDKSMRDRYPGLFDSDSSDDDSEGDKTLSRCSSFSFTRGQDRQAKAAKLDSSLESLEGLSIPRSSSSASLKISPSRAAIAAAAQLRRGNNTVRNLTPSRKAPRRVTTSAAHIFDTAPMAVDASQESKQSVIGWEYYNRGLTLGQADSVDTCNLPWSTIPSQQRQSGSPTNPQYYGNLTEPPLLQLNQGRRLIRCTCGIDDDRGLIMLQCSLCTQFSHAPCVGINPLALPPTFSCYLCTKPTTRVRVQISTARS